MLKRPSPLAVKMTDAGEGFTAYLDYILRTDRALFDRIEQEFLTRFPYYRKIALPTEELPGGEGVLALKFQTIREEVLSASSVSDGVMLFLAFLAISYAPRSWNVVLIEEPENGVHHTRLKEIVGTLKHLSDDKGVQVILTTHSPYLLDFVQPEEVHVFTRGQVGEVHTKRLSEYEDADEIRKHFKTGEMWSMLSEEHGI